MKYPILQETIMKAIITVGIGVVEILLVSGQALTVVFTKKMKEVVCVEWPQFKYLHPENG